MVEDLALALDLVLGQEVDGAVGEEHLEQQHPKRRNHQPETKREQEKGSKRKRVYDDAILRLFVVPLSASFPFLSLLVETLCVFD